MHTITKHIGKSHTNQKIDPKDTPKIKKILIVRPNHRLGNQLLITPLVQEVISTFSNCKIDLFVKGGVANEVFKNYKEINKIIELPKKPFNHLFRYFLVWFSIKKTSYDLVINGDKNSSSGKILTQISNAKYKVFGDVQEEVQNNYQDYNHISKYPVYNLRNFINTISLNNPTSKLPLLDLKLSESEIAKGFNTLKSITQNEKKTICIYTNATGLKCYSETWWETFYARLLQEFSRYNIIEILPIENISKVNFKAPHYYSNNIREMAAVINNSSLFISADNGVMHLASSALTPTVGFFSVTKPDVYAPYGNGSIAINTNNTHLDDWIKAVKTILN